MPGCPNARACPCPDHLPRRGSTRAWRRLRLRLLRRDRFLCARCGAPASKVALPRFVARSSPKPSIVPTGVIAGLALIVASALLGALGCGGVSEPASVVVDLRTVGEVQWSMPVQFTASNKAGEPVLDLTLGHYGLPNRFEIPAGSYTLTVGGTGCPRKAAISGGRTTHVVVTLRGEDCSIGLPGAANSS